MRDFKGSKYDSKLSTSDITKVVKKTIETKYPYMVITVKKRNFNAITAQILDIGFNPFIPEYEKFKLEGGSDNDWTDEFNDRRIKERLTADALRIEAECNDILQSYNYDNSEPMTDYFDVNFYGRFDLDIENHKKLYLSDSAEVQDSITRSKRWAEQDLARKAKRDERKQQFTYKYGDLITTEINYRNRAELTKEFALITKVPNGTSRFATTYAIDVLKLLTPEEEQIRLANEAKYAKEGWQKSKRNKYIGVTYIEGKPYGYKQSIDSRYQESLKPYEGNWTHWLKEEEAKKNQPKPAKEPKPAKPTPAPKASVAQPAKATEIQTTNPDVTIRRNEKLKGIEILFGKFPSDETRNYIKSLGFKWNSNQKLWYTNFSEATFKKVNEKFGPGEAPNKAFIMARAKAKLKLLALKF